MTAPAPRPPASTRAGGRLDRLGGARLALAAILALAGALRLTGIRYGLPEPLLNPDEANIVPRAWAVARERAFDPGWYDYPSLLLYVLAPLQAPFAEPSYVAARTGAVGIGLAGVVATWWLGRRAYGTRAAVVGAAAVAVATTHVAYSRMAVTDVLLTLGVTCALALAVSGRIEWAGAAVGLAAAAKYPGALALVPVAIAGWGRWRRLARAALLAASAFVAATPFVVLHPLSAWDDLSRVQRLAREGWLGFEHDPASPLAFADRIWETVGPLAPLCALGLAAALARRRRADLVLLSFAVAYALYLLPLGAHFDRYVLPLVPVLAVLAGSLPRLAPLALVALLVPLAWSASDARDLTRRDTRLAVGAWIAANVSPDAVVAADPSTLALHGRRVVRLSLPGPGVPFDARRDVHRLRLQRVRYVLVSGAVTDRVLAARERYPREAAFYDALAAGDGVALAFEARPGEGLGGPWARLHRLYPEPR